MPRSFLVRRNLFNAEECEQWNQAVKLTEQHPCPAAHQLLGRRLLAHLDDICSFHRYPGSVQQDCSKQRQTAGCHPLPVLDHCSCLGCRLYDNASSYKAYCSSLIAFTTSYRKVAEQGTVNREGPQTECAAVSLIDSQLLDSPKQFEDKIPSGTLPLECSVAEPKLNGLLPAKNNGAETRGRQIAGQAMKVKPNFQCEQCGKVFKTKYTLNIHCKMPSHTTSKPFVCPTCGKGFRLSSTLCRHKIIHTSQRPHCCHICNKSFNRSSTLKTHLRTHSNQKEFICEQCGKGFHQKGNLRNHALIHTGEKPYSCSVCNKSFNKLSNLKFHMHSHTDQKPYRCRFCKTPFCRRGELKMHITRYHRRQQREDKTSNS